MAGPFTVGQIAAQVGGEIAGSVDHAQLIRGVNDLERADETELSFLANRRYVQAARRSRSAVILVGPNSVLEDKPRIICADPYIAFAQVMHMFHPYTSPEPGVDPAAHVAADAIVDGARIEAFAWVGPGAKVGARTWVEAGAVIGADARVGTDCRLMSHSVVAAGCVVGDRVWLNPGAVVGGEGFGFATGPAGHLKIPQAGIAIVEDDVEIGVNSCVDRAAVGETRVAQGAKLDNLVQVGHGAHVGPQTRMVAYAGVAGSTHLGANVVLAAKAAVLGHLKIGDGVQVGVCSAVHNDQPAGARVTGVPAITHSTWLRAASSFSEIPDLVRKVRDLESRIATLEGRKK